MIFLTHIKRGKASLEITGLRCRGPRVKQPDQACNKLIAKKSTLGQIAGAFKCERCGQEIEVEIAVRP